MASFTFLSGAITTAQTLATGEFGFVGNGSSLEVAGSDAVTATGNVTLLVDGTLFGNSSALHHVGGVLVLSVGEKGSISGNLADTIASSDVDGAFVSNDGRLDAALDALDIRGTGLITILNSGTLRGDSDGIVTQSIGGMTRIVNRGTVEGSDDGGILILGGESFIVNRGTISGVNYGLDGDVGRDELRNFGSITGGVKTFLQDDVVINGGDIDFVELGEGADIYVGRRRGLAERVDGGGGSDLLTSSRSDDTFFGGLAGDRFVFAPRGGNDRIEDFGESDRIDLSAFDVSGFSELRPLIEDRAAGALVDISHDGLTLLVAGVDKSDLRPSDFIFELILS